ncbi:MAG: nucleotide exchange factor GrpE [Gammaproteobacteria bacterium]|nr:nucleotide exchange factor GrpE [Gammaproteobacteria bacterium]
MSVKQADSGTSAGSKGKARSPDAKQAQNGEKPADEPAVDETAPDASETGQAADHRVEQAKDTPEDTPADTPQDDEDLVAALVEAREQVQEMKDGFLRAQAEMENVRRRSQKEIQAARKYAIEVFAQELLPVKDSMEQATQVELDDAVGEAVTRMKEGLELTLKQLETVLAKFSVVEVEAGPGVKFNPDHHQAVSMVASEDIPPDHIISVMQKGFLLKDRLLRPAMVVVAS